MRFLIVLSQMIYLNKLSMAEFDGLVDAYYYYKGTPFGALFD